MQLNQNKAVCLLNKPDILIIVEKINISCFTMHTLGVSHNLPVS